MPSEVLRQGESGSATAVGMVEARLDTTLAVRSLATGSAGSLTECSNARRVVMVTTQDRLQIPPINTSGNWYETLCHCNFQQISPKARATIGYRLEILPLAPYGKQVFRFFD